MWALKLQPKKKLLIRIERIFERAGCSWRKESLDREKDIFTREMVCAQARKWVRLGSLGRMRVSFELTRIDSVLTLMPFIWTPFHTTHINTPKIQPLYSRWAEGGFARRSPRVGFQARRLFQLHWFRFKCSVGIKNQQGTFSYGRQGQSSSRGRPRGGAVSGQLRQKANLCQDLTHPYLYQHT